MQFKKTLPMIGIVAVVVGILGFSTIAANSDSGSLAVQKTENMGIMGHLTLVQKDQNGNIKAYRQSDNMILNNGKNCAPKVLFATSTSGCIGTPGTFNVIGLITATTFDQQTALTSLAPLSTLGLAPVAATGTSDTLQTTSVTATTGASTAVISASFNYAATATTSQAVQGAVLMDTTVQSTTTGNAFSAKPFSGGAVTLSPGDSLTVTWNISLNG